MKSAIRDDGSMLVIENVPIYKERAKCPTIPSS
jgi:hypothetical protein